MNTVPFTAQKEFLESEPEGEGPSSTTQHNTTQHVSPNVAGRETSISTKGAFLTRVLAFTQGRLGLVNRNDQFSYLVHPKVINIDHFMGPIVINRCSFF
jgi:hypothetical protein